MVDLPTPDGPTSAVIVPVGIVRSELAQHRLPRIGERHLVEPDRALSNGRHGPPGARSPLADLQQARAATGTGRRTG